MIIEKSYHPNETPSVLGPEKDWPQIGWKKAHLSPRKYARGINPLLKWTALNSGKFL